MPKRTSRKSKKTSRSSSARRTSARRRLAMNYTPPQRGWTYREGQEPEGDEESGEISLKNRVREEMIAKVAREWNDARARLDERNWRSTEESYQEADYHAAMASDYGYARASDWAEMQQRASGVEPSEQQIEQKAREFEEVYYKQQKQREREEVLRLQAAEELLSDLGARMMRPYEHWNEDERYMEWSERDRDY